MNGNERPISRRRGAVNFPADDLPALLAETRGSLRRSRLACLLFLLTLPVVSLAPCILGAKFGTPEIAIAGGITGFVLAIVGLGGAILTAGRWWSYSQRLALLEQVERMGFSFREKPPEEAFAWLRAARLWGSAAVSHLTVNVLSGEHEGESVQIATHAWESDPSLPSVGKVQTVYILEGLPDLPLFLLLPRSWSLALEGLLGAQFLPLEKTEFDDLFRAVGDGPAVKLFTPEVCAVCRQQPRCVVEMRPGRLIVCVPGRADAPSKYPAMMEHLVRLGKALRAAAG
jgi:hypothetical protein